MSAANKTRRVMEYPGVMSLGMAAFLDWRKKNGWNHTVCNSRGSFIGKIAQRQWKMYKAGYHDGASAVAIKALEFAGRCVYETAKVR